MHMFIFMSIQSLILYSGKEKEEGEAKAKTYYGINLKQRWTDGKSDFQEVHQLHGLCLWHCWGSKPCSYGH